MVPWWSSPEGCWSSVGTEQYTQSPIAFIGFADRRPACGTIAPVEPAPARLRLRRTGGIAGLPVEAALDTADLEPGEAEPILAALDAVPLDSPEIARLAGGGAPAPGPPDAFGYELDVTRGAETRRLRFGELDMPESLRALVALLRSRAKPHAR